MNTRRLLGIIGIILGISLYLFASYIGDEVSKGKDQIQQGQGKVNMMRGLTSISPYTKDIGDRIADSGQKKIDSGKEKVHQYGELANKIHVSGVVLIILGIGLVCISFIQKRRM